ncbi:MAG TPA: hypothetical protein VIR04_03920 [Paralcaligenes sp.]
MSYLKTPALAKSAVLAAAFALPCLATAAPSVATPNTAQNVAPASAGQNKTDVPHAKKRQHKNKSVAMWVPGFGPVNQKTVTSLKLNDSQQKLVAEAKAAQDDFQKNLHDLEQATRQGQKTQLDTGKIDPHAAQNAKDDIWKKGMGERRDQLTKKWLAVWDALDSTQQQKVTAYLKQKADKPGSSNWNERR